MAGTAIQRKETRLLLFQALERGSFEGSFFEKLGKDGAGMSYEFAKKYYKVTFEAYLITASYCVLGIINLGLTTLANDDPDIAVKILKSKSLIEIFQAGWEQIATSAKMEYKQKDQKTLEYIEKDFAEIVSADPEVIWIGQTEFAKLRKELTDIQNKMTLQHLLTQKYWTRDSALEGIFKQDTLSILRTIFTSLLILDHPLVPLDTERLALLIHRLKSKPAKKKLRQKILALLDIPAHLDIYLQQEITDFFKYLNELDKIYREKGESQMTDALYSSLFIKVDPDHISRQRYQTTIRGLNKGKPPDAKELSIWVSHLTETADVSEKLAIIDFAIKYLRILKPEDIIYLVEKGEDLWQKKIKWETLDHQVFSILMASLAREEIMADIFQQNKQRVMVDLWSKLPTQILVSLMKGLDSYRDFLLENVHKSGADFDSRKENLDAFVMFVPISEWLELWLNMDSYDNGNLFSVLIKSYRQSGLKPKKIEKLFFERVKLLAQACRDDPNYIVERCPAPFYDELLRKSVHDALSAKDYQKLRQELTKALKK